MERVLKKEEQLVSQGHNQTVRPEDESVINIDDDEPFIEEDADYTNRRGNVNPPKNMIEREPEREPEFEGNITHS